ncbi:hypothetical protein [Sphingomonas sp. 3-13AW]|uniref:hypothetical protein n=1 Tax=Sphingomonas sp. 3-13AW TaxID=3050450 RepID=UPI003BB719DF
MHPIAPSHSRAPQRVAANDQTLLTGARKTLLISEIDDEEAAAWDRIVALRAMGSC